MYWHSMGFWQIDKVNDMNDLGKIYVYPKYGMNNLTRGIQFLEQASKYGNSIADATLAELFSQGELISIDIDRALYYAEKFKASNGIQGERLYNDIYNKLSKQEETALS